MNAQVETTTVMTMLTAPILLDLLLVNTRRDSPAMVLIAITSMNAITKTTLTVRTFSNFDSFCSDGYEDDGQNCFDVNECALFVLVIIATLETMYHVPMSMNVSSVPMTAMPTPLVPIMQVDLAVLEIPVILEMNRLALTLTNVSKVSTTVSTMPFAATVMVDLNVFVKLVTLVTKRLAKTLMNLNATPILNVSI